MTTWKSALLGACAPLILSACATTAAAPPAQPVEAPQPPPAEAPKPQPKYGSFGFDMSGMDRAVAPGDSFFAYANGGWVKTTEIPADRGSYNTFTVLAEVASQLRDAGAVVGLDPAR